ncbi:MAG: 4Fe-4S dicluster domain-containing protein [Pirellulaceae bacterium]
MSKRIVLDLTKCEGCEACSVDCGYFYSSGDRDQGIQTLKERATFQIVCRRCEHASCVVACPYDALERQDDGSIKRFNLRCVSCKLCTQGCPFGTIYPEMVGFYQAPCNYCLDRTIDKPPCVSGCVKNAIAYRQVTDEPDLHIIDEHFAVIGPRWEREQV